MKAYHSLKGSIEAMDVYSHRGEIRIDEREISKGLASAARLCARR
jgi:hypothetical protein